MRNPAGTISLCMIVKNEANRLARCLLSVYQQVDEIIVIDTGSTDATPEVAKSYGATVIYSEWQNDFSRARNKSLEHATKEWILYLDADEELPLETARGLKKLVGEKGVEAWSFTIVSPISSDEDSAQNRHVNLRMFKNRPAYRFQGRVHEQVKPSILRENPAAVFKHSGLTIQHHGYIRENEGRREKTLRNIALLQESLAANPDDPFSNYNLGVSYFVLGDLENSQKHSQAAFQHLDPTSGYASVLYRNYALCLSELGEYARAVEIADRGLAYFPDYPDLHFLKGQVFWELGMLDNSKTHFLKCTGFTQVNPLYTTTGGVTTHLAFENLAEISSREGDLAAAISYITQAIKESPFPRRLVRLCRWLQQYGRKGPEIVFYLSSNFHLDAALVSSLLYDIAEYKTCLAYTSPKLVSDPTRLVLHVKCLLRLHRYDEALGALMKLEGLPPGHHLHQEVGQLTIIARVLQNKDTAACLVDLMNLREGQPELHDIAMELFSLGDKDQALRISQEAFGSGGSSDSCLALGRHALAQGRPSEAIELLGKALTLGESSHDVCFLLGTAHAELNQAGPSFHHFLEAVKGSPDNQLYRLSAWEQLLSQCQSLVLKGLSLESNHPELRKELYLLALLKKRAKRFKEANDNKN